MDAQTLAGLMLLGIRGVCAALVIAAVSVFVLIGSTR